MSYTMHSPSQGYSMPFADASADVYASRAYGSHLMAQNYSAYLNRDDPYNGHGGLHGSASHYGPNGPGSSALQSAHSIYGGAGGGPGSGLSGSGGISQQTYPTLPPISHFSHQQDLYSSCLSQRTPSHSLGSGSAYGAGGNGGGTSPLISSSMNVSNLSRQHSGSKAYWESVQAAQQQQQQQQQQNSLYGSAGNTPSHKSSPQSTAVAHWSHSPNVLSSPSSSTPSPIPCPSTPHHFNTSSSPHHQQQQQHHSQQPLVDGTGAGGVHKVYNGIGGLGSSGSNSSSSSGGSSNPLQSLQKMVQIDAESGNDLRAQYDTSGPPVQMGAIGNHNSINAGVNGGGGNAQGVHPIEGDPNFPTYYNLDQNRMCATPVSGVPPSGYPNIGPPPPPSSAHGPPQTPFSPTLKNGPPLPPLAQSEHHRNNSGGGGLHSSKSVESDNGSADLALATNNNSRSASVRFSSELSKEGVSANNNNTSFLSNRSCSTDTVCSGNSGGGSPSTVGSVKLKAASMVAEPPAILGEQTHDSVNSFRGSEATANSRDSVKSSDSDCGVLSAYVSASQCSTPNGQNNNTTGSGGSSNWKLNSTQSNDFRSTANSFSGAANSQSVPSSKAWWPENAAAAASSISPSPSSRSFTPHLSDCSAGGPFNGPSNYSSGPQLPQSGSTGPPIGSSSSSSGQHWSQSTSTPTSSAQMMPGNNTNFTPDGQVIVKKKRGRPFGSKNRRNLDQQAAAASGAGAPDLVTKRKRKSALVDAAVNTTLSFDVPNSLHLDDYTAFESYSSSSLKHAVPLAMKRKKLVGPVVRIEQQLSAQQNGHQVNSGSQHKYSVLNNASTIDDDQTAKAVSIAASKSAATFGKPVGVESICLPPPTSTSRKNSALVRRCTSNSNNSGGSANGNVSSTANSYNSISSPSSASSSDRNWVCVLCHKGPHCRGLGDLYGPYTVLIEKNKLPSSLLDSITTSSSSSNIDSTNGPTDQQQNEESSEQQSNSQTPAITEHSTIERRSLRRRVDSSAASAESAEGKGKTANSAVSHSADADNSKDAPSPRVSLEVWIHEDCIVWSNNVYLDGTVIRNLEQAIVESFGSICTKCKLPGATLGCIYKSCTVSPLHYLCAKDKDCDLDEEKFILSCSKHKKRRIPTTTTSTTSKEFEVVEVSEATTTATISEGCC